MSHKHKIALLFTSLLVCSSLSNVASAQVVDPCQYGCPKSGCPQCPEGGPIKSEAESKEVTGDRQNQGDTEKDQQQVKENEEKSQTQEKK
ncbi:MAG TPA: hypothetical protein VK138_13450 [Acidiferrobacterales bacterium]|nr:hypothetical protein [Acidiferrobacterales bacterium]